MRLTIYRPNETELIKGCIRGDRNAQKQLYDIYSPLMYPVCLRYMKNSMEAEDVLVIAFTRIFEKISQFKATGSLEGWIKRIVINVALMHLRKQRTMFVISDMEVEDMDRADGSNYDYVQEEELFSMLDRLPPGYRSVFNLYAIDGFSHKEIASHLGISENTSKSQFSRARVFLQKLLKSEELPNTKKHDVTN